MYVFLSPLFFIFSLLLICGLSFRIADITTGFFANLPLARVLANYECNATAAVKITHHFANRMIDEKLSGLIAFTSSPAGNSVHFVYVRSCS